MIAVDATPLALGPRRGVARALLNLLHGFAAVPPDEPVRLFSPAPLPKDVPTLDGVVLPDRPANTARAFRRRLRHLVRREKADVLYSPWSAFPRVDVPVVAVVHELPFVRLGPVEGRLRTWIHRRWLARNLRECAAIVVPSYATRDDLLALNPCSAGKVHVVPWGFDPAPWEKAGARRGFVPHGQVVFFVPDETTYRRKGIEVARAVFFRHLFEAPIEIDEPDDEHARLLVAGARMLLYPSLSEGFGFPPLEAMAAGVPVVASRVGSIPEVVGDAALLVPPNDTPALADAVNRVDRDEDLRRSLVALGRVRARAFPLATSALRIAEVLRLAREAS